MNKFILHGGFERKENDLNHSFYRELVKDLPDNATMLLVYFASQDNAEEVEIVYKAQTQRIRQITGKDLNLILATKDSFLDQLATADIVHFRGGYTPKLLSTLRSYPDLRTSLMDKVVSGSSAGAYALTKYGPGHTEKGIREGLGLVPVRLVCHYESEVLPPEPESYRQLTNMTSELELVQLRDFEWRVFK